MGKKDCQAAPQRKNHGQSHLTTVTTHSLVLIFVPQFPSSGLWELVAQGAQLYNIDLAQPGKAR